MQPFEVRIWVFGGIHVVLSAISLYHDDDGIFTPRDCWVSFISGIPNVSHLKPKCPWFRPTVPSFHSHVVLRHSGRIYDMASLGTTTASRPRDLAGPHSTRCCVKSWPRNSKEFQRFALAFIRHKLILFGRIKQRKPLAISTLNQM